MAVDPNIQQKADDIRMKIYGEQVRESLASGLEAMSEDVLEIDGRQTNLEGQFVDIQQQSTEQDVDSSLEIQNARDGEPVLSDRLNRDHEDVVSQLEQVRTEIIELEQEFNGFKNEQDEIVGYNRPLNDAIYSWWISPVAISRKEYGNKTFVSYVDSDGSMGIASYDHDNRTRKRVKLATFEQDDHNAPSINFMADGRVVVFYARHNADYGFRYRITEVSEDISTFGEEQFFESESQVTYVQAITQNDINIRVIWRTGLYKWGYALFKRQGDAKTGAGEGFNNPELIWLDAVDGQYYVQAVPYGDGSDRIRLFMYGHPIIDPSKNEVRYGYITGTGGITTIGGANLGSLDGTDMPRHPSDFHLAYKPIPGRKVRLLDVAHSNVPKFVISDFIGGSDSNYKEVFWNGSEFETSQITTSGKCVEVPVGNNYYFGGVNFNKSDDSEVYLSRENSGTWSISRWTKSGDNWSQQEVLDSDTRKLFRPYTTFNPVDGYRVFYMRGQYTTYKNYLTDIVSK